MTTDAIQKAKDKVESARKRLRTLQNTERTKQRKIETRKKIIIGEQIRKLIKSDMIRIQYNLGYVIAETEEEALKAYDKEDSWVIQPLSWILKETLSRKTLEIFEDLDEENSPRDQKKKEKKEKTETKEP